MSLARRERRALAEIEDLLRRSDPLLDAMLAHGVTAGGRMSSGPAFPRRRPFRPGDIARLLVIVIGVIVVICLAIAGVLTAPPARSAKGSQCPAVKAVPACVNFSDGSSP